MRSESDAETRRLGLVGELDLANADALQAELDAVLEGTELQMVLDMSELTFIDSTGIALLVALLGRDPEGTRVSFVPSPAPAVDRVLKLTGLERRLPLAA